MLRRIRETAEFLKERGISAPDTGIVLGTGLGRLAEEIEVEEVAGYGDIPHFPLSTVEFHSGKLIYGKLCGKQVLAMQGRFHFYEGHSMNEVVYPIRVMKLLGVQRLLLSNAAGAMNPGFRKGELMCINDHINLLPSNPLTGENEDELGTRFPDMSEPYSKEINNLMAAISRELQLPLHRGVYVAVSGPMLETRAEYRYLRKIGADAVGMSTVPEVIAANHMGLPCAAVSVLTDECDPDKLQAVDIAEIIRVAGEAEVHLTALFKELLNRL